MTNALTLRHTRSLPEVLSASVAVYLNGRLLPKLLVLSLPGVVAGLGTIALHEWVPEWTAGFPVVVLGFLESAVLGSAAIYYLDQTDRGYDVSIMGGLAKAWDHVLDLIAAAVLSFVIIAALCVTVVGIPFAVMRMVRWTFTSQAIMIDGKDGEPSLGYSADLVAGRGWPTAGSLLVLYFIQYVPAALAIEALALTIDRQPLAFVNIAVTALMFPFGTTARTLLYYDLKLRKALA